MEAPPANEDKDDCWWSNFIIIETSIPTFPFVVKPPPNGDEIDDARSFTIEAVPEYPPNPKLLERIHICVRERERERERTSD
jgi:hypothetical protein